MLDRNDRRDAVGKAAEGKGKALAGKGGHGHGDFHDLVGDGETTLRRRVAEGLGAVGIGACGEGDGVV